MYLGRFSSGIKWDHAKSNVQDESHIYYPSIDDEHDRLQTSTKFTIFKSTTSTHQESIHDYPDVYHDEDENEDEEENSTTTFSSSSSSSSSSSDITQKTALITKTTTSEIETTTPFTLQNTEYENHELYYIPTTMGPQEIAKFKAKAGKKFPIKYLFLIFFYPIQIVIDFY